MKSVILLYYRAPYGETPELLCACATQSDVARMMYKYNAEYPDAYPEMARFETSRVNLIGEVE